MRWTIHELKKKVYNDRDIQEVIDLNSFISEDFNDLKAISPTTVSGYFDYIKEDDTYAFYLRITTTLTMICSLTLKDVKVDLDFNVELFFSETRDDDDIHLIQGITIDLAPYIFSEIVIEKPMRVVSDDAQEIDAEVVTLDDDETINNSPFAKLKK